MEENTAKLVALREKVISELSKIKRSRLNGHPSKRLPGNINMCFEGIEGESMLLMLDAIGLPHEIAHGSLRISLSEFNTLEEVNYIIENVTQIVSNLRKMSPLWEKITKGEKGV